MTRRRICAVTGSRADYGVLQPVMQAIASTSDLELQVVATCMHLAPEFGLTYRAIEADGFVIDAKVDMQLSSDAPAVMANSMARGISGTAQALTQLSPDIMLLVGDRFEALAAAQAALLCRLPIAHIGGGDVTEGAYDEAMRHSISKMAHLHFVTNHDAERRLRQLGEDPAHIHLCGNPALDHLRSAALLDRAQLENQLGYKFRGKNLLVTFHPVTLGQRDSQEDFAELLSALSALDQDTGFIFTLPNADAGGRALIARLHEFVAQLGPRAVAHASLGQTGYFSTVAQVDAVVGNSSSGLCEVPSLHKPTVNIGDRQKGRPRASSVIDCEAERSAISSAIHQALTLDCSQTRNPYGDGHAAERIATVLQTTPDPRGLLRKRFFDYQV